MKAFQHPASMAVATPSILLVSLDPHFPFDEVYTGLFTALKYRARVSEVTTKAAFTKFFSNEEQMASLAGVLVTDAGIVKRKHRAITTKLVEYARGGGVVIIGFSFPTFVSPPDADAFFSNQLGLSWKFGNYHRETFRVSPVMARFVQPRYRSMVKDYNMKAVQLVDVPEYAQVYVSTEAENQTAVAFQAVGEGYLGWIGDVNTEAGSTGLVLAMCVL